MLNSLAPRVNTSRSIPSRKWVSIVSSQSLVVDTTGSRMLPLNATTINWKIWILEPPASMNLISIQSLVEYAMSIYMERLRIMCFYHACWCQIEELVGGEMSEYSDMSGLQTSSDCHK